jgi:hypothetical protein
VLIFQTWDEMFSATVVCFQMENFGARITFLEPDQPGGLATARVFNCGHSKHPEFKISLKLAFLYRQLPVILCHIDSVNDFVCYVQLNSRITKQGFAPASEFLRGVLQLVEEKVQQRDT